MNVLRHEPPCRQYKHGWKTLIESDTLPPGLNEDVVRAISAKKNEPEWLLDFRLKAYRRWLTMVEPSWSDNRYPALDYQSISYYSAPKQQEKKKSLDELDPELLRTFERLNIPINEQKRIGNVAVDAVFDSTSIATTFRKELAEVGVIFCSISEAVRDHPELIKKHLGSVVCPCPFFPPAWRSLCGIRSLSLFMCHLLQHLRGCARSPRAHQEASGQRDMPSALHASGGHSLASVAFP